MVSLEQISVKDYVDNYLTRDDQILFEHENIINYRDLEDFIRTNPVWRLTKTGEHFEYVKSRVETLGRNVEPTIYSIPSYSDSSLEYNDKIVFGSSLILSNPVSTNRCVSVLLEKMSVKEMKHRLTHLNCYFKNYLEVYGSMTPARARKALIAIKLYNEQIERQALEISRRDVNLFTYMLEERRELVYEQISDIIMYLIENTEVGFVWGELTGPQKKKYLSAAVNSFKPDVMIKDNLIDIISSHVTMSEIEEGLTQGDTLKRFIIK